MKLTCTRRIHFCAGHRLMDHEGNCINLHGHNYVAELYAESHQLDELGRVIDFGVLKDKIGSWIHANWDHGFIRSSRDELAAQVLELAQTKQYVLPYNPTAENLARYLLTEVCPTMLKNTHVQVTKVVLWETENCFAQCSLDD